MKAGGSGRADLSPPVPDLADQGFPLEGGRLDYVEGRRAAALVYGRRHHILNLFAWPEPGPDRARAHSEAKGYTTLAWRRDGIAYAVVSDLNRREMEEFANAWAARAAEGNDQ